MAREVKINLTQLDATKQVYDKEIANLENAFRRLKTAVNNLQSGEWNTNGSKEFFKVYNSEWEKDFENHISYLKHLQECLGKAQSEFHSQYGKGNRFYN